MFNAYCDFPNFETALEDEIKRLAALALTVADDVPHIIRKYGIDGQDVNGSTMPDKKPRPKRNPRNNPTLPLIDTARMMAGDRWDITKGETQAIITYTPPDYLQYLISKAPDKGGRNWLNHNQMNVNARMQIELMMFEAVMSGLGHKLQGGGFGDAPAGFSANPYKTTKPNSMNRMFRKSRKSNPRKPKAPTTPKGDK